ncbi:MAG TPA: family 20 glycosylhydrolase, partial [Ferruginibacter sp.]|nr:family 20 glycosylhydrolase [Ferruginibacter sp.]
NLWTEYISNEAKLEYMLFPRISALAEALWTPKEKKDWDGFTKRLPAILKRYALWKVRFSTAYYNLQPTIKTLPD